MAHRQGILVDTTPRSARPELTARRWEMEKAAIAAWRAAAEDEESSRRSADRMQRYHDGDRAVKLLDWERAWLRAQHPERKEYLSFEPVHYFEDLVKKRQAKEDRDRVAAFERNYPLLQPVPVWTPRDRESPSEDRDEKKDEADEAEAEAKALSSAKPDDNVPKHGRADDPDRINTEGLWFYTREQIPPHDLMSFD